MMVKNVRKSGFKSEAEMKHSELVCNHKGVAMRTTYRKIEISELLLGSINTLSSVAIRKQVIMCFANFRNITRKLYNVETCIMNHRIIKCILMIH